MATVELTKRPVLVFTGAVVLNVILISAQVNTTAGIPFIQVATFGVFSEVQRWTMTGFTQATLAGTLGAAGAVCIIYAFRAGGLPTYVMPLVFGGAPLVNVLFSMYLHPPKVAPNPLLWVGFALVAIGASLVLYFKPQG